MSTSVAGTEAPPREAGPLVRRDRLRRGATAAAGPALIVAGVLFTLRGFAFQPLLTNHHPDVLAFWLPRFAFLGQSLAAGHVPLWNPYEMIGYRFAADPQSGFLYAPAMLLFAALPAGAAMRALIVLNPIVAGLGLFWFLRRESLSRVAATAGGLSLAMLMSTSEIAISLPFAGFLAWTTIALVAASGYRRSERWSGRLAWLALGAFAWSQVANAHMSHGLAMCTLVVAAYLVAHAVAAVRAGRVGGAAAAGRVALFLAALPIASLAVLVPRLAFIGASSLHDGYASLGEPLRGVAGVERPLQTNGVWAAWPLGFAVTPGAYAGAAILLAVPLALRARAHRALVWAFGGALLIAYVLLLNAVVTAGWFRALMLRIPFGDVYLHNPGRLRYVAVLAIPVLGAVGIQGLRDDPMPARRAAAWLGGGAALLLPLPLAIGGSPVRLVLLAVALCAAIPVLYALATHRHRAAALAVASVLALELLGSAVYSGLYQGGTIFTGLESGDHPNLVPQVLRYPDVEESEFLRETAFVEILRERPGRYLTWAPPAAYFEKGYLFAQRPQDWPALALARGTLFGVADALGYNPVQLPRYWTYIRATNRLPIFYNASVIDEPTLEDVRLLGVRYLIVPKGFADRTLPGRIVATADDYHLIEVYGWEPVVSVVTTWTVVDGPAAALRGVLEPGFDPAREAYLEHDPGIDPRPVDDLGGATHREASPEDVRISVNAPAPSIVVVRTSYDPAWTATIDGRPAPVLPADSLLLGVPVPAGRHEVRLRFEDPWVGRGAAASAVAWSLLLAATATAVIGERRRSRGRRPSRRVAGGSGP